MDFCINYRYGIINSPCGNRNNPCGNRAASCCNGTILCGTSAISGGNRTTSCGTAAIPGGTTNTFCGATESGKFYPAIMVPFLYAWNFCHSAFEEGTHHAANDFPTNRRTYRAHCTFGKSIAYALTVANFVTAAEQAS